MGLGVKLGKRGPCGTHAALGFVPSIKTKKQTNLCIYDVKKKKDAYVYVWRSENNLKELAFSFHYVGT